MTGYSRELSDLLVRKGDLKLAKVNLENKEKSVASLKEGMENLKNNHNDYTSFFNETKKQLKSMKEDILQKAENLTDVQREEYMKELYDRIESSKVILHLIQSLQSPTIVTHFL